MRLDFFGYGLFAGLICLLGCQAASESQSTGSGKMFAKGENADSKQDLQERNSSPASSSQDRESRIAKDFKISDQQYFKHIEALKKKYKGRGFHYVLEKPFVVIGDEPEATVKLRSKNTVAWAVKKLKAKYFKHDPDHIINIWLFKDKRSYEKHCVEFFGSKPSTPYGYYQSSESVLVMNISTGGGTLVHEIVHPFIERNFPKCPSWFNEGLASLYEQSGERNGQITGFTNWRLAGLQQAIIDDQVPSFKELCSTTTNEFYQRDKGTNYSQARYLCYYLQEKKMLKKFYESFRANVKKDPTGYQTLCDVLGKKDLVKFKKDWEKYVLKLRYGR